MTLEVPEDSPGGLFLGVGLGQKHGWIGAPWSLAQSQTGDWERGGHRRNTQGRADGEQVGVWRRSRARDQRWMGSLGVGKPGDLGVGFLEDPLGRLSASPAADLEPPGTLVGDGGGDRILVALDTGQEGSRAREDLQGT